MYRVLQVMSQRHTVKRMRVTPALPFVLALNKLDDLSELELSKTQLLVLLRISGWVTLGRAWDKLACIQLRGACDPRGGNAGLRVGNGEREEARRTTRSQMSAHGTVVSAARSLWRPRAGTQSGLGDGGERGGAAPHARRSRGHS